MSTSTMLTKPVYVFTRVTFLSMIMSLSLYLSKTFPYTVSHSHCIHHSLQKHVTPFEDMHTAHMSYSDLNELFVTKGICVLHA